MVNCRSGLIIGAREYFRFFPFKKSLETAEIFQFENPEVPRPGFPALKRRLSASSAAVRPKISIRGDIREKAAE